MTLNARIGTLTKLPRKAKRQTSARDLSLRRTDRDRALCITNDHGITAVGAVERAHGRDVGADG